MALSGGRIPGRRGLAGSPVKPQGPGPYLLYAEHLVDRPRVGVEDRPQCALIGGLDRQERDILIGVAADRPAEDDDPAVDKAFGEGGVLVRPAGALIRARPL